MFKTLMYYFKATLIITFSKDFKSFEKEYTKRSPEYFYNNEERTLSDKEKKYVEIIHTCYNYF